MPQRRRGGTPPGERRRGRLSNPPTAGHVLRRRIREQDELIAALVHDLRDPLHSILTWSHLLREGRLDDATAERAIDGLRRHAELQARRLESFAEYWTLSRPETRLEREPVELAPLVGTTVEPLRSRARDKPVHFETELGSGRERVLADRRRLELAVRGLVEHALEVTPPAGRVAVNLRFSEAGAEIEVRNSGDGFDAEELAGAFEPVGPTDRGRGSLRLDLAIAERVARLHGGRIEATVASPPPGAIFVLHLPSE